MQHKSLYMECTFNETPTFSIKITLGRLSKNMRLHTDPDLSNNNSNGCRYHRRRCVVPIMVYRRRSSFVCAQHTRNVRARPSPPLRLQSAFSGSRGPTTTAAAATATAAAAAAVAAARTRVCGRARAAAVVGVTWATTTTSLARGRR